MNNKTTNILALIALILQAVYVFGGFIIVAIQKKLFFLFMDDVLSDVQLVIPFEMIVAIIHLLIFIIFLSLSQKEGKKVEVIILVILAALISLLSIFGNMAFNYFYALMGAKTVTAHTIVIRCFSYISSPIGIPAATLFYVACGRYTVESSINTKENKLV